jgi:hypothetical protein
MAVEFGYNRWDRWYGERIAVDGLAHGFSSHLRAPVPFSLGAGGSRDVHLMQFEMEEAVRRFNLACSVSTEAAMIARTAGYSGREAMFNVDLMKYLSVGAVDEVASVVVQYNEQASTGRRMGYRPFTAPQLAVGN